MVEKIKTRFERIDERFGRTDGDEWMERLYADGRWTEGPAYFPAGRYLVFSDIPNDRVLRWDEITGAVGVLQQPATEWQLSKLGDLWVSRRPACGCDVVLLPQPRPRHPVGEPRH